MKKYFSAFVLFVLFFLLACSSSQELTYRPVDSKELWNIRLEKGTYSDQFEVYVNDEIILEETPNMFTNSMDEKTDYKGHIFRLIVNYSSGFLGIGEGYTAVLYCDNELVTQLKF